MENFIEKSFRVSNNLSITGAIVYNYNFLDTKPNVLQIINYGDYDLSVSDSGSVSAAANYDIIIPAKSTGVYVSIKPLITIYFYCATTNIIKIKSWNVDKVTPSDLNRTNITQNLGTTIIPVAIDQTTPGTTNGVKINAGSALIGKVGIDQVTANANEVVVKSLPAGASKIGEVSIDQTTPGSTNGVQVNAELPAGAQNIGGVNVKEMPRLKTPVIYNVACTNADIEYSQALPTNCKRFGVSVQDGVGTNNFRVAFVTGKVATPTVPFLKIKADREYFEDELDLSGVTLYFAANNAGAIIQITAWTE